MTRSHNVSWWPTSGRTVTQRVRDTGGSNWDSFTPTRPLQSLWLMLAVPFGLVGVGATLLRVLAPTDDVSAMLASFVSYGVLAYLLSTLFFLIALVRARKRGALSVLTLVSVTLMACHLAWLAPLFVSDQRAAASPAFTLLSLNIRQGTADPEQVAREARQADVVVLLETTTEGLAALEKFGWTERFPYVTGSGSQVGDTILYSRFPLSQSASQASPAGPNWMTATTIPQLGSVRIIAAHPCNPFCGGGQFRSQHSQLRATARSNLKAPLVIAGDLNAVDDHAPIRALRRDGVESVTDILGAGWLPTYPANQLLPPLLPIDHVLVNDLLTATSITRVHVDGTDHLGLLVTIARAR